MNKNTVIAVLTGLLIVLGVYTYIQYKSSEGFKIKIEQKETELLELRDDYYVLQTDYDVLEDKKNKVIYRESKTQKKLNDQINETNTIQGIVNTYSDRVLDSIITNHKHTKRAEN